MSSFILFQCHRRTAKTNLSGQPLAHLNSSALPCQRWRILCASERLDVMLSPCPIGFFFGLIKFWDAIDGQARPRGLVLAHLSRASPRFLPSSNQHEKALR